MNVHDRKGLNRRIKKFQFHFHRKIRNFHRPPDQDALSGERLFPIDLGRPQPRSSGSGKRTLRTPAVMGKTVQHEMPLDSIELVLWLIPKNRAGR